ncbi:hypothetical protein PoB_002506500 [Plakobranchus ocellatus]|uniref:Uncharacterized protein n=1 Tax=Plakobranchus ocellatus TaxID=259542 RepID=A0AAV3ZVC4_9GAST|nr:hypothetical protein PoB_002506500 [Plakobranchus ocellatus]
MTEECESRSIMARAAPLFKKKLKIPPACERRSWTRLRIEKERASELAVRKMCGTEIKEAREKSGFCAVEPLHCLGDSCVLAPSPKPGRFKPIEVTVRKIRERKDKRKTIQVDEGQEMCRQEIGWRRR